MKKPKNTALTTVSWLFLYLAVLWLAVLLSMNYENGMSILALFPKMAQALADPFTISLNEHTLAFVAVLSLLYAVGIAAYYSSYGKRRIGEEHGSASWGSPGAVNKLFAQDRSTDRILTQHVRMGLDEYKHRRNLNALIIGGSGAGKTRGYALPNIMQANSSFIVTDAKGEIIRSIGNLLVSEGYEIKVLDLINFHNSDRYNPFRYIKEEKDVIKLINNLIRNTTPKGAQSSEPFWEKSETALLQALMFYLLTEAPREEQNFGMVMTMLEYAGASEQNEQYLSPLDLLFMALEETKPDSIALRQYQVFKQAAGKTAKSILVSVAVRLAAFNLEQIRYMTNEDELDIASIGEKKTALFAIVPDNDTSFNFLIGLCYTQIFQTLYYEADNRYKGRLPVPVHFMLDEFPNIPIPEEFDKCLATMRSRGISASIIIQNLAQLKSMFKGDRDMWETVMGNCDTLLYLGGNETSTHEVISKMLGKATIDTRSYGLSRGRNGNYSTNRQIIGRELLLPNEVREIDNDYGVLFIRGAKPVWDKKFKLESHPRYALTAHGKGLRYVQKKPKLPTIPFTAFDFENAGYYEVIE
jgi:type IV secretion system protein VirD4